MRVRPSTLLKMGRARQNKFVAFLRKELGISEESGCTRLDCKRVHKEALNWSKSFVLGQLIQLIGLEGHGELTQAIHSIDKFL